MSSIESSIATYPSLSGKTVLVTGGANGIGESLTRHFHAQGSKVGILDLDRARGEALAEELGEPTAFQAADVTDIAALHSAIDSLRQQLGPIEILINNAAHDERHENEAVTPEYWDDRIAVNLKHQFFAAQNVTGDMKGAGGGSIINMGSISWMVGIGGMPCYTTSKAAIMGLTRSLARDLGPYNIRVNSIAPGWIMTERQVSLWLTPEAEEELMQNQCLKRKLFPQDIARVALFLASEEASACTSQTYVVDGGWL